MTLTLNIEDPAIPEFISPAGNREALKELGRMIVRRFYATQTTAFANSDGGVPVRDGNGLYRRAVAAGGTTQKKNGKDGRK